MALAAVPAEELPADKAAALRAPFPAELIGKLPRLTCKACSDNKQEKHCPKHTMVKCKDCGNWISAAHMHLDYVGHAATTDRLLSVDPSWTWEPMALTPEGAPLISKDGLWIRLTVCGVTRPGFGDGSTVKEMIGDAIRNAAMRFGVALDLWSKEDLIHDEDVPPSGPQSGAHTRDEQPPDSKATAAVAREGNDKAPEESGGGIGSAAGPSAPSEAVKALRDALQQLHPGNVVWRQREKQICLDHKVDSLEQIDELKLQTETHNVLSKVKP